jgi:hypothetical protein
MKIKPAAIMLMTVTVRNAPCNRDLYDCSDLRPRSARSWRNAARKVVDIPVASRLYCYRAH